MEYRRFGATQLTVSEIGFGCARFGGVFDTSTKTDVVNMLHSAFDQGITFFDTADMYTGGESEKLLGEAFRNRRDKVIIASKAGYCLPRQKRLVAKIKPLLRPLVRRVGISRESIPSGLKGSPSQQFSASYLLAAVEGSLKRLKTDYLDLYQLHSPPTSVLEQGDFIEPLERLKNQGKIRYYGVSCETTEDALVCLQYPGISSLQIRLSLLEQSALQMAIPGATARGIAIIAREVFAGGMLAKLVGADNRDEAEHGEFGEYSLLAVRFARPLAQMAVQFIVRLDGISVALLGIRTERQLAENLHYLAAPELTHEELQLLRVHAKT